MTSKSLTSLNSYLNFALASGVWLERETHRFPSLWFLAEPSRVTVQWQRMKNGAEWNNFNSMFMLLISCRLPFRWLKIWSVMEKWRHHRLWKKVHLSSFVKFKIYENFFQQPEFAKWNSSEFQRLFCIWIENLSDLQNLNLEPEWCLAFEYRIERSSEFVLCLNLVQDWFNWKHNFENLFQSNWSKFQV